MAGITTQATLQAALQSAHRILEATMADVDDTLAGRPAPGKANPVGSCYAHTVLAEDAIVQGMLQGQPPLFATTWAGRTGTDLPMPMPGMTEGGLEQWYETVRVDVAALRQYAQAVYRNSEAFIGSATDGDLERPMDMSNFSMGPIPLADMFSIFVIGHCNNLCGEISAMKGVHGHKGYPF
jgi:DinB superfamily